jgi:hypothetical protein
LCVVANWQIVSSTGELRGADPLMATEMVAMRGVDFALQYIPAAPEAVGIRARKE